MKTFSKMLFFALTMGILFSGCAQEVEVPPEEALKFTISFENEAYTVGDPIECTMILENQTRKPITVNQRFAVNEETGIHDVFFIIYDPFGNRLPFLVLADVPFPTKENCVTLDPDDLTVWVTELSKRYDFSSKGEYTVQAVYESEFVPEGIDAWKGKLSSNIVKLTVR
jgi:ABC-type Fe3+-hydroxamate transport system substrate-binding protein